MDHDLSSLVQVDAPARMQGTALAANGVQQLFVGLPRHTGQLVARLQRAGVMLTEVVQQFEGDFFFVEGIFADGAAGRQVVAALGHDDAGPQHAGGVVEVEVVRNGDALLDFGHPGLVAGFGSALALEGVDQRGLAHVGNAANQHPHRLGHTAPVGGQFVAGSHQRLGGGGHAGIQRQRTHAGHGVVVRQPERGAFRVRQVLLVEHFECGLGRRQLGQHGVGARPGQACIEQLNDDINLLDAFLNCLAGQVHMPREPLNCHAVCLSVAALNPALSRMWPACTA